MKQVLDRILCVYYLYIICILHYLYVTLIYETLFVPVTFFSYNIVPTETKKEANELALDDAIKQECAVLHGDIAQAQRETTFQVYHVYISYTNVCI